MLLSGGGVRLCVSAALLPAQGTYGQDHVCITQNGAFDCQGLLQAKGCCLCFYATLSRSGGFDRPEGQRGGSKRTIFGSVL